MRHELHTEIDIEAPNETVSKILTDLDEYSVLVRFMRKMLDTQTHDGFIAMNDALKARSEAFAGAAS